MERVRLAQAGLGGGREKGPFLGECGVGVGRKETLPTGGVARPGAAPGPKEGTTGSPWRFSSAGGTRLKLVFRYK